MKEIPIEDSEFLEGHTLVDLFDVNIFFSNEFFDSLAQNDILSEKVDDLIDELKQRTEDRLNNILIRLLEEGNVQVIVD
jgi:hypothetical protein